MQLIVNVQNRYKADRENDGCLFTSNVYNRQILLELLVDFGYSEHEQDFDEILTSNWIFTGFLLN